MPSPDTCPACDCNLSHGEHLPWCISVFRERPRKIAPPHADTLREEMRARLAAFERGLASGEYTNWPALVAILSGVLDRLDGAERELVALRKLTGDPALGIPPERIQELEP